MPVTPIQIHSKSPPLIVHSNWGRGKGWEKVEEGTSACPLVPPLRNTWLTLSIKNNEYQNSTLTSFYHYGCLPSPVYVRVGVCSRLYVSPQTVNSSQAHSSCHFGFLQMIWSFVNNVRVIYENYRYHSPGGRSIRRGSSEKEKKKCLNERHELGLNLYMNKKWEDTDNSGRRGLTTGTK